MASLWKKGVATAEWSLFPLGVEQAGRRQEDKNHEIRDGDKRRSFIYPSSEHRLSETLSPILNSIN